MSNFEISDSNRFAGDFSIQPVAAYVATRSETTFLDTLSRVLGALEQDEANDVARFSNPSDQALVQERRRFRTGAAHELREQAQQVYNGQLAPEIASDNLLVIKGKYVERLGRLALSLFVVGEEVDPITHLATSVSVRVAPDLPPPNDVPSPEKQALYVAISAALTVIKSVSQRMKSRAHRWWREDKENKAEIERAERLVDLYVRKLAAIGRLGLQGQQVQLANLALAAIKAEFVAEEAGRIKNAYLRRLGVACFFAGALALAAFWLMHWLAGAVSDGYKSFFLAACGASVGTWLSFSMRRVSLAFDELGILEDDLLEPGVRVIFVLALTMTVCLLFWTGAINLEVGNLKTGALSQGTSDAPVDEIAILVGVFCGIAERTLATAISGRASAFVKGVAGAS